MTLTQMIERIQQEFPDINGNEIILELNKSYEDITSQTDICKVYQDIDTTNLTNTYDLGNLNNKINGKRILEIRFLDSDKVDVTQTEQLKWELGDTGVLKFYNYYNEEISSMTPAYIRIYYSYLPEDMSTTTDEPDFLSHLQDYIIYDTLEKFHAVRPTIRRVFRDESVAMTKDFESIRYYNAKAKEILIKAKKYANSMTTVQGSSKESQY